MKLIRNIFIITMIVGLTVPKDWMIFVSHIPDFIEHYQHHTEEHNDVSVLNFALEHISENNHHESDSEHEKLPFNHQHSNDCNYSIAFISLKEVQDFNLTLASFNKVKISSTQLFHNSQFTQSIWQPPKFS